MGDKPACDASVVPDPKDDDFLSRAIVEPVVLIDHDPAWAAAFEAERDRLMRALPDTFVAIEHIGSTAVPGLRTKPVLDLLAGVRTMDEAFALNAIAQDFGYGAPPEYNAPLETRQWFMRQSGGRRTHHLHVVVHDGDEWRVRVAFRDRLRRDATLRADYVALKDDLARRYADDRDAYTEGKSAFITAAATPRDPA
jgi:GrpB-like predicted nucleotidyltransferase (UPF0157 family)